ITISDDRRWGGNEDAVAGSLFFYEVCGKAFPPPVYQNLLDDSNKYRKRKADMGDFLLLKPHALVDLIKKNAV
ncbi:MAG: hypothetical protein ACI35N_00490, partial [Marinilabiliaceae bacterium]